MNFPRFSFALAFVTIMLGKHKPQHTTAAHTYEIKSNPRDFLSLFLVFEKIENPKSWDFYFFACNCFCEDGS